MILVIVVARCFDYDYEHEHEIGGCIGQKSGRKGGIDAACNRSD